MTHAHQATARQFRKESMRKMLLGIIVAAVFFFVGRRDHSPSFEHTTKLIQNVASNTKFSKSDEKEKQQNQSSQPEATAPEQQLLASFDSQLFEQLYSKEFKNNWKHYLPTLKLRLYTQLPNPKNQDDYDKEVVARLGILKSLSTITAAENDPQLKEFLFNYLEAAQHQPWPLKREALHTLHIQNDLTEAEQQQSLKFTDAQTRNTAALTDRQLLLQATQGDR